MQAACELVRSGDVKLATRQLRSYTAPSTNILDFAMAPVAAPLPRGWQWLRAQQLYAYDVSCVCNGRLWKKLNAHVNEALMPSQGLLY